MNRAFLIAAAVGAFSTAAPALAQPFGLGVGSSVSLDARIDQSLRAGALDMNEAARVRADVRAIAELESRYRYGGIDARERQDLDRRYAEIDARLNARGRFDNRNDRDDDRFDNRGSINGWQSVNARLPQLERRIEQGQRNGAISAREAVSLRAEIRSLATLDARYRASGGVDARERYDLDRRFDQLSARIRVDRADRDDRGSVGVRQAQLERRIEMGVRNRTLSASEAARLRAEFRSLAVLESRYRATGGLDSRERDDLDRRFASLEARLRVQLADRNFRWDDGFRYR